MGIKNWTLLTMSISRQLMYIILVSGLLLGAVVKEST